MHLFVVWAQNASNGAAAEKNRSGAASDANRQTVRAVDGEFIHTHDLCSDALPGSMMASRAMAASDSALAGSVKQPFSTPAARFHALPPIQRDG